MILTHMKTLEKCQDVYTAVYLLDYTYFKENYNMITIDFSKQQALDADLREIQQINFTGN